MEYGNDMGALMALGVFSTVFLVIGLGFYVLKSIGLYTLANNRGIENAWLAWIPIADLYIMGMLVGEMDIFGMHIDNLGLWYPVAVVCGGVLGMIPFIGVLFSIALLIFSIVFIYKMFEMYTPSATLFTVLSILLCLWPIFIFVIRNNELLNQAGNGTPAEPMPPTE